MTRREELNNEEIDFLKEWRRQNELKKQKRQELVRKIKLIFRKGKV